MTVISDMRSEAAAACPDAELAALLAHVETLRDKLADAARGLDFVLRTDWRLFSADDGRFRALTQAYWALMALDAFADAELPTFWAREGGRGRPSLRRFRTLLLRYVPFYR